MTSYFFLLAALAFTIGAALTCANFLGRAIETFMIEADEIRHNDRENAR